MTTKRGAPDMQLLKCPHCDNEIEVYEPADLDHMGLTANPRADATSSGELQVWARLRSGKLFLYLKQDVDAYLRIKKTQDRRESARKAGINEELLTDEQVNEFFDRMETQAKRAEKNQGKQVVDGEEDKN